MANVPTYALYGEKSLLEQGFWLHCETILSRSRAYRFEISLHRHEHFLQFLYIRTGSGDALFGQTAISLKPPCVIAVPAGLEHGFRFSKDIDGFVVTLLPERLNRIDEAALTNWLRQPLVLPVDLGAADMAYLDATFLRIAAEYDDQLPGRDDVLGALVASVVAILSQRIAPRKNSVTEDAGSKRFRMLQQLIARHYRQHLSVEQYAQMMGMSATHLNRIVRKTMGQSTHDLLTERLMEEACKELLFTGYSVQQISDNLGFTDPAYFARVFRQRMGMTPRQFRETETQRIRNKEA